jgi:rare lipoprotein A (peptidoglycan hydrolase)
VSHAAASELGMIASGTAAVSVAQHWNDAQ